VAGRHRLYRYCEERKVEHRRCGKLIVATQQAEIAELERLAKKGAENGVNDLVFLDRRDVDRLEGELRCAAALFSPSTGIIDSHAYMLALQGEAGERGAFVCFRTPFDRAEPVGDGLIVHTAGPEPFKIRARTLVNAAGLRAVEVAHAIDGLAESFIPEAHFAKGNYFALSGRAPFSHLIYPVPEPGGLGVHLTLDLANCARFGPDVEWVDSVSYTLDPERRRSFYDAIRRYWPGLKDDALVPAYAGVRPKISGPNEPAADFCISGPGQHGVRGLINLFGIESPGLTASLALADEVAALAAH